MNKNWLEIKFSSGYKYISYSKEKKELYLIAWLDTSINIIPKVSKKNFDELKNFVNKNDHERFKNKLLTLELNNDKKSESYTRFLIKEGKYEIDDSFIKDLPIDVVKKYIKNKSKFELKSKSFLKKNNFYKKQLEKYK